MVNDEMVDDISIIFIDHLIGKSGEKDLWIQVREMT